jgi:hypothetical protein
LIEILIFEEKYELFIAEIKIVAREFIEFWREVGKRKKLEKAKL